MLVPSFFIRTAIKLSDLNKKPGLFGYLYGMGCPKLTYRNEMEVPVYRDKQNPELRISYRNKELTPENSKNNLRSSLVFGSQMPGRSYSSNSYRFSFNGAEKDDEWTGVTGSHLNFKHRMYDSRIARFFAVDPLSKDYPYWTPYQFAGLTPIWARELEGLEPVYTTEQYRNIETEKFQVTTIYGGVDNDYYSNKEGLQFFKVDAPNCKENIYAYRSGTKPQLTVSNNIGGQIQTPSQNTGGQNPQNVPVATIGNQQIPQGGQANFNLPTTFTGGQWNITNQNAIQNQANQIINALNSNPNATLLIMGNVAGNPATQNWNSPSSTAGTNMGQLAVNRANAVAQLLIQNGLNNPNQLIMGQGFLNRGMNTSIQFRNNAPPAQNNQTVDRMPSIPAQPIPTN